MKQAGTRNAFFLIGLKSKNEYLLKLCMQCCSTFEMKSRCPNVFSLVADAVYTAWGSWQTCETCGLTNRRRRSRDCVDPGMLYTAMGACAWRDKNELEHCYRPCGGLKCYWTNCKQFLEFTGCSRLKCRFGRAVWRNTAIQDSFVFEWD